MEQKILDRILELTNEINELLIKREETIKNIESIDKKVEIIYNSIHELKDILSKDIK